MTIGVSASEAWSEVMKDLHHFDTPVHASRAGETRELLGYRVTPINPYQGWCDHPLRKASPIYAAGELMWYLAGSERGSHICAYAPQYKRFLEGGLYAHGAYGPRINLCLNDILDELKERPETRQAVIPLFRPDDTRRFGKVKDIPCTLSLQFLVRDQRLTLVTTMRSNDIWLGFPYDVFAFTCIQRLVAHHLNVAVGPYYHNAGSMHVYDKNWQKGPIHRETSHTFALSGLGEYDDLNGALDLANTLEAEVRELGDEALTDLWWDRLSALGIGTILTSLCLLCSLNFISEPVYSKHSRRYHELMGSRPMLKEAVRWATKRWEKE